MTNIWTKIAGLSGASAIALGAVGAHALTKRSDGMKETWRVGNLYHLAHSIVLFQLSTLANVNPKKRKYACILFTGGILLFSGSCYTVVLMDQRQPYSKVAPIGGFCFIFGWLALALM